MVDTDDSEVGILGILVASLDDAVCVFRTVSMTIVCIIARICQLDVNGST